MVIYSVATARAVTLSQVAMVVWTAATDALIVKAAVAETAPPEPAEPAEGEEAAEAEAVEPPEEKPPPTPLEAATTLLASEEVKSAAAKGASPAESFTLACEHLKLAPHPAIVKGLEADGDTLAVRGWQVDLSSLVALVHTLGAQSKLTRLQLWRGGLGAEAAALLQKLPASLTSLSIEGEDALGGAGAAALVDAPSLQLLSLRCCSLGAADAAALGAPLRACGSLTSLSLWGNRLGDDGAAAVLGALRGNATLLALNLGSNLLTDAAAEALLEATREAAPAEGEGEGTATGDEAPAVAEGEGEGGEAAAAEPAPNRTLTALNLSRNRITTTGRAALEAAQEFSPSLARLDLTGNPCLSAGPGAALSREQRAAVKASWSALAETEGGAAAAVRAALVAFFGAVPAALALSPLAKAAAAPSPPADGEEAAEEGGEAAAAEAPSLDDDPAMPAVVEAVTTAVGELVGCINTPEALKPLLSELGLAAASRGLPAGEPFDKFGETLVAALAEALGDALADDGAAAWRASYAEASRAMQGVYTPAQLAEAAAAAAAAAEGEAPAEGEEGA